MSDYGVEEIDVPTDWESYAQSQTNVEVVSDVLWYDQLDGEIITDFSSYYSW